MIEQQPIDPSTCPKHIIERRHYRLDASCRCDSMRCEGIGCTNLKAPDLGLGTYCEKCSRFEPYPETAPTCDLCNEAMTYGIRDMADCENHCVDCCTCNNFICNECNGTYNTEESSQCETCDRCNGCCGCYYCGECGTVDARNNPQCDNCDRCPDHCDCRKCENCESRSSDICPNCSYGQGDSCGCCECEECTACQKWFDKTCCHALCSRDCVKWFDQGDIDTKCYGDDADHDYEECG